MRPVRLNYPPPVKIYAPAPIYINFILLINFFLHGPPLFYIIFTTYARNSLKNCIVNKVFEKGNCPSAKKYSGLKVSQSHFKIIIELTTLILLSMLLILFFLKIGFN